MSGFRDDTEEAVFNIAPGENVYSYFMFITPTEQKKEGGGFTWDTIMAYVLVILNFFMQSVLLYTIFYEVVVANLEWQNGIMRVGGKDWNLFAPGGEQCNPGGSLCVLDNNTFTCAPPSVQLTGRWDELDTNGDGIWTLEEVEKAKKELQCKYVVNPVEVFNVFITFLKEREKIIWLHPDVKAGKAIHKPYFTYAAGDIIMCGYRNQDMCANLLERGVFHAPLKYGTAPRVGTTIESALDYCWELLHPGGTCERTLPSTYAVWTIESASQCGDKSYSGFVYEHPKTGVTKSLLKVDYAARQAYELSQTPLFLTYKTIIVFLWLLAMLVEFKDITQVVTWVLRYPSAEELERQGEEPVKAEEKEDGETQYTIQGITQTHRIAMGALSVCRFILTCVLTYVGVNYLLKQTDYIGLLMDAVALVFIVEIAMIIYEQVLRPEIRGQLEHVDEMQVPMYGITWLNQRPAIVDVIQLVACLLVIWVVMVIYYSGTIQPLYDALQCTCLSQGDNCFETERFSKEFWDQYWSKDVPAVFAAVDKMKSEGADAIAPSGDSDDKDDDDDSDDKDDDDEDESSGSDKSGKSDKNGTKSDGGATSKLMVRTDHRRVQDWWHHLGTNEGKPEVRLTVNAPHRKIMTLHQHRKHVEVSVKTLPQ